jgi:hypothetical protein
MVGLVFADDEIAVAIIATLLVDVVDDRRWR